MIQLIPTLDREHYQASAAWFLGLDHPAELHKEKVMRSFRSQSEQLGEFPTVVPHDVLCLIKGSPPSRQIVDLLNHFGTKTNLGSWEVSFVYN